jgi:hypothetical protein
VPFSSPSSIDLVWHATSLDYRRQTITFSCACEDEMKPKNAKKLGSPKLTDFLSLPTTVQNCSARASFERAALGQLLQGVCDSRFTVACCDSPGLTSHRSESALAFANDEP